MARMRSGNSKIRLQGGKDVKPHRSFDIGTALQQTPEDAANIPSRRGIVYVVIQVAGGCL